MNSIELNCPYCGEIITIVTDDSVKDQKYIEDCEVCCRPIVIEMFCDEDGDVSIVAKQEDDF